MVGVLRHSIRAALAFTEAKRKALSQKTKLLICVANDRAEGDAVGNAIPRFLYPRFLAVTDTTTTKYLPSFLYLFRGCVVILEDLICEDLGLVRGCRCIVDEVVPHVLETRWKNEPIEEPFIFTYMPKALLLRCPKAKWRKEEKNYAFLLFFPKKYTKC